MPRFTYELILTETEIAVREMPEFAFRNVVQGDFEALVELMLDAYEGTIDDEGETIDDATGEVGRFFGGAPILDASFLAEHEDSVIGACLVSMSGASPIVAYAMTAGEWKAQGLGAALVERSLSALAAAGHSRVTAVITEGNEPSERMAARLGFERV